MAETSSPSKLSVTRLILIPAIITLAVTLLRLTGELLHWSSILFSRAEGGGGAIVGISWLPFVFGPFFAVKLWDRNHRPSSCGKTIGFALLGFLVLGCGSLFAFTPVFAFPGHILLGLLLIVAAAALQFVPWHALARTLIAYAYTARVPVAIVMYFAMQGSWGTHYDAVPPGNEQLAFWPKYFYLGIAPQLLMWIAYTMTIGALFGAIYVAVVRHRKAAEASGGHQAAGV